MGTLWRVKLVEIANLVSQVNKVKLVNQVNHLMVIILVIAESTWQYGSQCWICSGKLQFDELLSDLAKNDMYSYQQWFDKNWILGQQKGYRWVRPWVRHLPLAGSLNIPTTILSSSLFITTLQVGLSKIFVCISKMSQLQLQALVRIGKAKCGGVLVNRWLGRYNLDDVCKKRRSQTIAVPQM